MEYFEEHRLKMGILMIELLDNTKLIREILNKLIYDSGIYLFFLKFIYSIGDNTFKETKDKLFSEH